MMSTRRVKYNFKNGEHVLCFEPDSSKAKVLYDAKVLDVSVSTDKKGKRKPSYLIHFLGWNNSWDRVVPESFLLGNTDENRVLMKKLETISHRVKSNKLRMKKIDYTLKKFFRRSDGTQSTNRNDVSSAEDEDSDDGEEDEEDEEADLSDDESRTVATGESATQSSTAENSEASENESEMNEDNVKREPVCLDLPDSLKRKLERDCCLVKQQKKLLKLPANPNVVTILEGYVKYFAVNVLCASPEKQRLQHQLRSQKQQTPDRSIQLCKETVDGLRIIFDFALPLCLLYDNEVSQYNDLIQHSTLEKKSVKTEPEDVVVSAKPVTSASPEYRTSRGKRRDSVQCCTSNVNYNSEEDNSVFSETVPGTSMKKEAEEQEVPSRRVTRNSSGQRDQSKHQVASHAVRSRASKPERSETLFVERPSTAEPETRRSSFRTRYGSTHCDPAGGDGVRTSQRLHGGTTTLKSEPLDTNLPSLNVESEPSEVSSHISQILASHPEMKAICSQKEEEVSNIFAWKLLPDELQTQVPVPPSLIYGAHHLLRLFVPLPDLVSRMEMQANVQTLLVKHLQTFIDHLNAQCDELFAESNYVT